MTDASSRPEPANARDAQGAIEYIGHAPTAAKLCVVVYPPAIRPMRALRALGICWALAIAAVFLPLLHFVLVPGLLIAVVVLGVRAHAERATILALRGACPACGEPIAMSLREGAHESLALRCTACGRPLTLRPEAKLAA